MFTSKYNAAVLLHQYLNNRVVYKSGNLFCLLFLNILNLIHELAKIILLFGQKFVVQHQRTHCKVMLYHIVLGLYHTIFFKMKTSIMFNDLSHQKPNQREAVYKMNQYHRGEEKEEALFHPPKCIHTTFLLKALHQKYEVLTREC